MLDIIGASIADSACYRSVGQLKCLVVEHHHILIGTDANIACSCNAFGDKRQMLSLTALVGTGGIGHYDVVATITALFFARCRHFIDISSGNRRMRIQLVRSEIKFGKSVVIDVEHRSIYIDLKLLAKRIDAFSIDTQEAGNLKRHLYTLVWKIGQLDIIDNLLFSIAFACTHAIDASCKSEWMISL